MAWIRSYGKSRLTSICYFGFTGQKIFMEDSVKLIMILIPLVMLVTGCGGEVPEVSGYWTGWIEMFGKKVDLSVDFGQSNLSSSDLMIHNMSITKFSIRNSVVEFSTVYSDATIRFIGTIHLGNLAGKAALSSDPSVILEPGIVEKMAMTFYLTRVAENPPEVPYEIENVVVNRKSYKLSTEIFKPKDDKTHPAVVLIHGSSGFLKQNLYFWGDYFARLGMEVLVFDKQGNGSSSGNSTVATLEDLADDVVACLEVMNQRQSVIKSKIGLWGISQGAMILPFVASKTNIPSFLIGVSPDTQGIAEAAAYADALRVIKLGYSLEDAKMVAKAHGVVALMIRQGRSAKEVESFINQNAQKYPFMNQTGLYGNRTIGKEAFLGSYWSGRKHNFLSLWKTIKVKTLCLFGEDDDLVDPVQNPHILRECKNPLITIFTFPRANHMLKKTVNPKKYQDFDWPRKVDAVFETIEGWLEREVL